MKKGGLSIADGRTGFKIVRGRAILLAFIVPEELKVWAKMQLPEGRGLEPIVQQMQGVSSRIGTNFAFGAFERNMPLVGGCVFVEGRREE
ncbi:hypothetical protein FLONG3_6990 [Fusarium longipes]|uniref:Uncharacterized protein n=1 Tax=Fusarium longipes TaxID=694270 RepID=A0A395SH07_9HYPO|nr:hypothetical protein FLONG3_6990 [Fusarium longipes]